jgi:predicted N-acetyltransferase YhbS
MEIRAAKQTELEEVIDLAAAVFVERCRPRYASQHLEDSTYALHQSRVCVVDGRVVSQVRVSEREMRIGSAVVKLGGVGLVGTLEKYRRNGYSSAVLRDAVEYMAAEGYDLGLLFTSIQPFYARLGWAPFSQTTFDMELGARKEFDSSPWTVREFEPGDLPRVIEIYGEHNRARTGIIVRTPQQWSDGYARQTGMPPTLVAERNGVIGAYANVGLGEGGANNVGDAFLSTYYPNIREVGCAAGSEDALVALSRSVLERAHDAGLKVITGRLPRHDPMTLLLSRESGVPLSFSIHERSMYLVISLSSLLTKVAPELQRRLQSAGVTSGTSSYLFEVDGQSCALIVDRGSVYVEAYGCGSTRLELDSYRFFKLLFGDSTFTELAGYNRVMGLNLSPNDAALLDVLFPKGEHTHWICDYF